LSIWSLESYRTNKDGLTPPREKETESGAGKIAGTKAGARQGGGRSLAGGGVTRSQRYLPYSESRGVLIMGMKADRMAGDWWHLISIICLEGLLGKGLRAKTYIKDV
jgi:hypothetical protein